MANSTFWNCLSPVHCEAIEKPVSLREVRRFCLLTLVCLQKSFKASEFKARIDGGWATEEKVLNQPYRVPYIDNSITTAVAKQKARERFRTTVENVVHEIGWVIYIYRAIVVRVAAGDGQSCRAEPFSGSAFSLNWQNHSGFCPTGSVHPFVRGTYQSLSTCYR